MGKVLIVIDVQNDYFSDGAFPLWHAEATLEVIERAVAVARAKDVPVVLVQHFADTSRGPAPFFNRGTTGAEIHTRITTAAPGAPVVVKAHADSFVNTTLEATLASLGATELLLCGMMTHNCVTHTALSKSAEKYDVTVVADGCTTVSEILHLLALHALSTRVRLAPLAEAL
ncbi:cysteine hydrolase family protein [Polyangium sp. y55x31]|uniref:cysteine hydrolase family protein n=1 Tax=Polyangium sp. y55x31 TaxID=3042688 RepID=UPI00248218B5|nr:cysteine hydrolase family protein [Polyangium sp. y55x31]MDI1482920.1 cysteine hydrolase family protein [Polyangium sp. y55x31]